MPLLSCISRQSLRPSTSFPILQSRSRGQLAPKRVKYRKAHKGSTPIPTGGSIKGTTLTHGDFGLRVKGNGMRLSAKQLQSADTALKRKLKIIKGAKVWLRLFPDIPVCVKGNEVRMGKGKGTFEFWACRAGTGRVIFEVGGDVREEIARDALRLAADKLPCITEFINKYTGPRLGNLDLPKVEKVGKPNVLEAVMGARGGVPISFDSIPPSSIDLRQ